MTLSVNPNYATDLALCCRPKVAVQEMRRLQRYGITPGELERYKTALLRDSEQLAEQACRPSTPSMCFASHRNRAWGPPGRPYPVL